MPYDYTYTESATREDFEQQDPIPKGPQHAVCRFVIELGHELYPAGNKWNRKIVFGFEIPAHRRTFQRDGQTLEGPGLVTTRLPFTLRDNQSTGGPSNFRAFLERWKDGPLRTNDSGGFVVNLGKLVEIPCTLEISHKASKNPKRPKPSAIIDRVYPYRGEKPYPTLELEPAFFMLDQVPEGENPLAYFPQEVPKWIKEAFQNTREGKAALLERPDLNLVPDQNSAPAVSQPQNGADCFAETLPAREEEEEIFPF
jgi:hypothetical protein